MDLNGFDNYSVNNLISQNTENDEPEKKEIGEKYQDNNEFIIHNNIINARWNLITDMIQ